MSRTIPPFNEYIVRDIENKVKKKLKKYWMIPKDGCKGIQPITKDLGWRGLYTPSLIVVRRIPAPA